MLTFRTAKKDDVEIIVEMLTDDALGKTREMLAEAHSDLYLSAFERIDNDPNQELIVAERDDQIIGTLQLTFIPYLTYQGGVRAQVEAVRVHKDFRGNKLGEQLFEWAIARAKERGAHLLQLTTDKRRPGAVRFYEKLGFEASHEGMKLHFEQ